MPGMMMVEQSSIAAMRAVSRQSEGARPSLLSGEKSVQFGMDVIN